ncbi:putative VP4 [Microviridae sp.]|nr:putative VP4 [Microviridae sp.]
MPCTHPNLAWPVGKHPSGSTKYYITEYNDDIDHVEITDRGSVAICYLSKRSPVAKKVIRRKDALVIPCGQCIGCRMDYSREWADRIITEIPYHESAYFLTLTYDDAHLPINEYVDPETGVIGSIATLVPQDVTLFVKRLRRYVDYHSLYNFLPSGEPDKLMYFFAGEYGSQTRRPHYHAIIFGLRLDDLKLYKQSTQGNPYYNSEMLNRIWGKGYVVVADANWQSAAYVARYILKKQTGDNKEIYERFNYAPEFTRMSLKPAIGRQFALDHMDELFKYDSVPVSTPDGGRNIRPPKYFKKLMKDADPDAYERRQLDARKAAEVMNELKLSRTDKTYMELMEVMDEQMQATVRRLPRPDL